MFFVKVFVKLDLFFFEELKKITKLQIINLIAFDFKEICLLIKHTFVFISLLFEGKSLNGIA